MSGFEQHPNANNNGVDDSRPSELAHYPIIHQQPIHWGEMDAFNHLNNVVYYRYAESARIGYLQALGMFGDSIGAIKLSVFTPGDLSRYVINRRALSALGQYQYRDGI